MVLRVIRNLANNSGNFYIRDAVRKVMGKIVGKLEENCKTQANSMTSSYKLKGPNVGSKIIIEEDKDENT